MPSRLVWLKELSLNVPPSESMATRIGPVAFNGAAIPVTARLAASRINSDTRMANLLERMDS
jgi:hypothetical protein